ncbi:MAG: thioredoxin [Candidatus Cloacimonas sp.]|jgi:thioredoxin 1|nr:thioredoxin [Candidatus Cloacimonadota bacterium]
MSVIELNSENFDKEIGSGVTAVDFWAPWCGPCKILGPVLNEIAVELEGKAKIAKLNVDDSQEIALRYRVMSIPTVIVFKDGKPISSTIGVVPKKALKDKIEAAL